MKMDRWEWAKSVAIFKFYVDIYQKLSSTESYHKDRKTKRLAVL